MESKLFFRNVCCTHLRISEGWLFSRAFLGSQIIARAGYATYRPSNYYDTLEVTPNASHAQIKAAYYRLSKKYHPDVNDETDAKTKFTCLSEAYEVLGNKKNRALYDRGVLNTSNMSSAQSVSEEIDKEYADFLKKHSTFRKKSNIPTGKTSIYDFDEFYRQHYGETVRQSYQNKQDYAKYEEELKKHQESQRINAFLYLAFLLGSALAIVFRTVK